MAPLCPVPPSASIKSQQRTRTMLDPAYITLALVGFALFALAVEGCERL